jgi:hypothetical protein
LCESTRMHKTICVERIEKVIHPELFISGGDSKIIEQQRIIVNADVLATLSWLRVGS